MFNEQKQNILLRASDMKEQKEVTGFQEQNVPTKWEHAEDWHQKTAWKEEESFFKSKFKTNLLKLSFTFSFIYLTSSDL